MRQLKGVAASPGAAVAPARVLRAREPELPEGEVSDPDDEVGRLADAIQSVAIALDDKAASTEGELAEVLDAQATMARDPELAAAAEESIRRARTPGARAVVDAGETFAGALEASESEYMAARAEDVRDVCRRIARVLLGDDDPAEEQASDRSVLVASELPPADVAALERELVAAIVTEQGSRTSHTAIVARALAIPAVVGVPDLVDAVEEGGVVGVDGDEGAVFVSPDDETRARLEGTEARRRSRRAELRERTAGAPAATRDGHRVELAANVGALVELRAALEEGAEAVGLLRTELLYLDRSEPPSEEEQAELLSEMVGILGDRRLVVRTFDFGADKPGAFLDLDAEENPALGLRGIRLAASHPDLFEGQLRAVARAAKRGRVGVMAPMVATPAEAEWFADRVGAAGGRRAGVEVGVMVEVPAAVMSADELADRLDFLSIGTNDLGQYLHAADRQLGALHHLQDPFSPSLLRAVKQVCDAAEGRAWVGVCGEAAGDPTWALVAVGLGVEELSMGADGLLEVKAALGDATLHDCREAAAAALAATDAAAARAGARERLGATS